MLQTSTRGQNSSRFREKGLAPSTFVCCSVWVSDSLANFHLHRWSLSARNLNQSVWQPKLLIIALPSPSNQGSQKEGKFCSWLLSVFMIPQTKPVPPPRPCLGCISIVLPLCVSSREKAWPSSRPLSSTWAEMVLWRLKKPHWVQPHAALTTLSSCYLVIWSVSVCLFGFPTTKLKIHEGQGLWLKCLL